MVALGGGAVSYERGAPVAWHVHRRFSEFVRFDTDLRRCTYRRDSVAKGVHMDVTVVVSDVHMDVTVVRARYPRSVARAPPLLGVCAL